MRDVMDIVTDLRREYGCITAPRPYADLMSEAAEWLELFARTFNEDTVLALASQILGVTPGQLQELKCIRIPAGNIVVLSTALQIPEELYLPCDGRAVSRKDYPELYEQIGDTYGTGESAEAFCIPRIDTEVKYGIFTHPTIRHGKRYFPADRKLKEDV